MKVRILDPVEWQKIPEDAGGPSVRFAAPQSVLVLAIEDDAGNPAAFLTTLRVTHLEGLWVAPEYKKNAGVMRALLRAANDVARECGEEWVLCAADDTQRGERMGDYLRRLGARLLPARFYSLPVRSA
jgi:hypothetical protein